VLVSMLRSKCELQYRMKATYASAMFSALTSLGGKERSVGRYENVESIVKGGNLESR
jgi:hypothetical protein